MYHARVVRTFADMYKRQLSGSRFHRQNKQLCMMSVRGLSERKVDEELSRERSLCLAPELKPGAVLLGVVAILQ